MNSEYPTYLELSMKRSTGLFLLAIGISFALSLGLANPCAAQTPPLPDNAKRILFLGNSITYSGQYVSYIEAYLTLRYPEKQLEFINVGLPSETVSGLSEPDHAEGAFPRPDLHERLARVLANIKPDLVFACYGMNDGIYLPFDDSRFQKFREGIVWLHNQIKKSGASIIHITPPVYDERKGPAYANVIDIYSDWLISCRYTANWEVIDLHWPMRKHLEAQRRVDPTFKFAEDGVHANATGHFIMAREILLHLGETALDTVTDIHTALAKYKNGDAILPLVEKRQAIMKDAWLTATGHKRPGMRVGMPITEAQKASDEIGKQIEALLQ